MNVAFATAHNRYARIAIHDECCDFHFHDLRHHGAAMALNAGFTREIVMALGGWKSGRMIRRYAAVTD